MLINFDQFCTFLSNVYNKLLLVQFVQFVQFIFILGNFKDIYDQFHEEFEDIYEAIYAYRLFTKYLPKFCS